MGWVRYRSIIRGTLQLTKRKQIMQYQLQTKELWPLHQAILLCEELPTGKQKAFVQGKEGYYCVEQAKLPEQYCVKFFKQVN